MLEGLQQYLMTVVSAVNSFLWDWALLILLLGTGVYFTIRLRFIQVRKFGAAFRLMFRGFSLRGEKAGASGMSSFQSLATAIAAQVGTGNIAGAATAMIAGGPGAIFWMWVSAFFGMATIFAEATLAKRYKAERGGRAVGGPVYYIRAAIKGRFGKVLAACFSVFLILALGFMGNMVQSNSIADAMKNAFGFSPVWVGVVTALLAALIFMGGVQRIAAVTEKIVPIMAIFYVIGSLIIVFGNITYIPEIFCQIVVGAFAPQAVVGGAMGIGVQQAMRYGVARGLFSNEAGMGSTPHAHALAQVDHPGEQGYMAMVGVFIDTFVVLTMTALVIMISGLLGEGFAGTYVGIGLAQAAFRASFGNFGTIFIAICLFFFAFSTIIGWYFFGEMNVRYLFRSRCAVYIYAALVVAFVFVGAVLKVDLVWSLADMFNGLMVIPNLIGLLLLSNQVVHLSRDFEFQSARIAKNK